MRFVPLITFLIGTVTSTPLLRKKKDAARYEKLATLEECEQYFADFDQDGSGTISAGDVEGISQHLSSGEKSALLDALAQMLYATGVTNIQDDFSISHEDYVYFCVEADDMDAAIANRAEWKKEMALEKRVEMTNHIAVMKKRNGFKKLFDNELQVPSCMAECGPGRYCGSGGCQDFGSCGRVFDCFQPDNLFPIVACVGEMECNGGQCGINCGAPPSPAIPSCLAACGPGEYCGSGGCQENGSCELASDCFHPNNLYPDPRCIGEIECGAGKCVRNCGEEDPLPPPPPPIECRAICEEEQYCGSGGCKDNGSCETDGDCLVPSNYHMLPRCVGNQYCTTAGQCWIDCAPEPEPIPEPPVPPRPSCMAECGEGQYCGSDGCQDSGTCGTLDDCSHPENIFPMVLCVGEMECDGGQCAMNCGVEPPPPTPSCMAECGVGQYCGSGGCQDNGSCGTLDDCFHPENLYPMVMCVGDMHCSEGQCGMVCGDGGDATPYDSSDATPYESSEATKHGHE